MAHFNTDNKVQKIVPSNALLGEKYVLIVKIKITLQVYKRNDTINALIANVTYHSETANYFPASTDHIEEITVSIQPLWQHNDIPPISIIIYPDSGASICLAGIEHFSQLHLLNSDLMSKKGYSHRRLQSFVQKMVTNTFHK